MTSRSIIAVMLTATVCIVILSSTIGALFYPPGTVTETFRSKIFELLLLISGIVSGYLAGNQPPKP